MFNSKGGAALPALDALVVKPGDTVILRTEARLTREQRQELMDHLSAFGDERGVKFFLFSASVWEACVIPTPA